MTDSGNESLPPESWRYTYLEKCIQNFVNSHRDKPGSCKQLRKSFPEIFQQHPEALTLVSDSFGNKYTELTSNSINELVESSGLREKLELAEKFTENDVKWRPSGNPGKDIRAHIALTKQSEIQNLEQQLAADEEELQKLRDIVAEKDKLIKKKLLHANALAEEVTSASRVALCNQANLFSLMTLARAETSRALRRARDNA